LGGDISRYSLSANSCRRLLGLKLDPIVKKRVTLFLPIGEVRRRSGNDQRPNVLAARGGLEAGGKVFGAGAKINAKLCGVRERRFG
jgi:hypothetical protein